MSVRELCRAGPDRHLNAYDPRDTGKLTKADAVGAMEKLGERLAGLQERLYAEHRRSLLLVLQGMDTSGKGGVCEKVVGYMNPAGVAVHGFKAPTPQEKAHHFLWRIRRALPTAGRVVVFDRSHYEDVGIVAVHRLVDDATIKRRHREIREFEAELARSGCTVVKCFLHISFAEQTQRLTARLDDPTKRWKFNPRDLDERDRWGDYMDAYTKAIAESGTEAAPWYVIPADRKWYRNWVVANLLVEVLEGLDPAYPQPVLDTEALRARLESQTTPDTPAG